MIAYEKLMNAVNVIPSMRNMIGMSRKGITLKIFVVTTALLVVSALIIYSTLYFLLPGYYKSYKKSRLEQGVNELVSQIDNHPYQEMLEKINEFGQSHNAMMAVRDTSGKALYFPLNVPRFENGRAWNETYVVPPQMLNSPERRNEDRRGKDRTARILNVTKTIHFQDQSGDFLLTVNAPLQPVDEAREVILMFLPYMLIAIVFISIGGAYFYSRMIARPLLGLNKMARRLAKLDFSAASSLKSNDEIGELSASLNELAGSLKSTMYELTLANAQLKNDIQKEREQEAKRREFVATISHELKTPITAVSGQLEAMIHNIGIYSNRDKYLRQSYKIMKEMDKLVHEILDLSQLESRDFKPQLRSVELSAITKDTVEHIRYLAETKRIELVSRLDPEARIHADERLIAKAVANIMINAIQYSAEGEKVFVHLTDKDGRVGLQVLNTGARIEPEQLSLIFQPFYRIEKSRNRATGGSGLGLYIVSQVLDGHGAGYRIENVDEGVLFTVVFHKSPEGG